MIEQELGIEAELRQGDAGQFDVYADGERIASRGSGLWTRLLGGGWPEPGRVVETLRRRAP